MADIKPFRGYIYNTEKIKDIAKILAPPYDVISPKMQDSLYKRSDFNVVRLILAKEESGKGKFENKYKKAKSFFEEFIRENILVRDSLPSIYMYDQEYSVQGKKKNRTGFIALIKLQDPEKSKVLPHEHTFEGPKKDRLMLMREAKANSSSIFSIFADDRGSITSILQKEIKRSPIFDVYYEDIRQRLWRISDPKLISDIKAAMKGKQIFIADGHHRYETALTFRQEMRKGSQEQGERPFDYVMMYFASMDEAKLTILATHRVIKDTGGLRKENIKNLLAKHFVIKEFKNFNEMCRAQENSKKQFIFGMYAGGDTYFLLELKDISDTDKMIKTDKSMEWRRLDVTLLHYFILQHILKIKEKKDNIIYLRESELAVEKIKNSGYELAFFLKPTKLEQVKKIAQIGEKMPYKSTYFYPKLLSGTVINKFD